LKYGRAGEKIKIEIYDNTDTRIDRFWCNDEKGYKRVLKIIEQKYGFNFNSTEEEIEKEKDWLKSNEEDMKWE